MNLRKAHFIEEEPTSPILYTAAYCRTSTGDNKICITCLSLLIQRPPKLECDRSLRMSLATIDTRLAFTGYPARATKTTHPPSRALSLSSVHHRSSGEENKTRAWWFLLLLLLLLLLLSASTITLGSFTGGAEFRRWSSSHAARETPEPSTARRCTKERLSCGTQLPSE
ncbi:hypothetical protein B0T22DRAFT_185324 [Podospora appendiculata]|uniref:Uncharacterized protein n=1 Tax=Podospora appendiculata TaxID=314037 RepID=A0AAE1CDX7_9PEZI|nr:hypothetical protein B0T22DRAFT_185324 [Podospora appendiculata]